MVKINDEELSLKRKRETTDGDTSTEGSTSPDLILSSDLPTLNVNAPAFTSVSSMTPVIITKNVDIGNERWKPNATVVEENVNTIPLTELPQPFLGTDGLYYWPTEVVAANYTQPVQPMQQVVVDPMQQIVLDSLQSDTNTAIANGNEQTMYPQPVNVTELVSHAVQTDALTKEIPGDELKRLIQLQFEYYFSRENLANDSYLVSQMDGDQYVSISTIAKFNQIRKLTADMNLIVEALKESPYVQLDETEMKVRANMKRCIVILREIPESTPVEEVKAIFSHPNCPKWSSFEFAHNDSWYVTFDCEDDAKRAYRHLREEVQNFRGRPLMARIKAKTLLSRTVYLPKSATSSTTAVTMTTPTESTAQFTPPLQPVSAFQVPPNAVFHQPQTFPFYANAPMNGNPLLPGAWMAPRRFIQHDVHTKNNFSKHNGYMSNRMMNGPRSYYNSGKPRHPFRSNYKVPMHERNGANDQDERSSQYPRPRGGNNSHNNSYRKDDSRFVRTASNGSVKKDYRTSVEESPRFQRLRERRGKDEPVKSSDNKHEDLSSGDLSLDLALENFPALPSPNSPNENNKSASSLKELASNALQLAQNEQPSDVSPLSVSDLSEMSTDEIVSSNNVTSEALLVTAGSSITVTLSLTTSAAPKISYAQMAQKPNKTSQVKETYESDLKDLPELPATAETKKNATAGSNNSESKNDSKPGNTTPKSQRRSSRGSPRTPRGKTNQETQKNEKSEKVIDNSNSSACPAPVKETYASKFGKSASQPSATVPRASAKAQTSNITRQNIAKTNSTNLPPPRPLMSQIIKPPESKMNELVAQHEEKSFSDTVKTVSLEASGKGLENDTATLEDSNKENIKS